ncbi:MAG: hypothetical protein KAW14_05455 [Candidatus Aegiribacteria sp.]|nr:hypothetical protein [Candidatus Aegiribacteria sp.]
MKLISLFVILLIPFVIEADVSRQGISAEGGLTGYPFLPGSRVLERGFLRIQGRLEYADMKNDAGSYLLLPLNITWGCIENLELGGEIPIYLDDSSDDGHLLGDISAGCSWLYETARGGSALVFKGLITLPTGSEGRDTGSELAFGIATSTTFRLLRLHTAASYVLNGGRNPFEGRIIDYMKFSAGGASYLTGDLQIICGLDGTTTGDLGLAATITTYAVDKMALFVSMRAGLSGNTEYSFSAGAAWTMPEPEF